MYSPPSRSARSRAAPSSSAVYETNVAGRPGSRTIAVISASVTPRRLGVSRVCTEVGSLTAASIAATGDSAVSRAGAIGPDLTTWVLGEQARRRSTRPMTQ